MEGAVSVAPLGLVIRGDLGPTADARGLSSVGAPHLRENPPTSAS